MSRVKLILLSLVAVFAVGAIASAPAMAVTEKYMIEKQEVTEPHEISAFVGPAYMNSVVGGIKFEIECDTNALVGKDTIEAGGKSKGEASFSGCTLYSTNEEKGHEGEHSNKSTKCKLREPIQFKYVDQLVVGLGGIPEDEFKPASGEIFVEIGIESQPGQSCVLTSILQVKGAYVAAGGPEGEIEKQGHELWYQSTGSKLTVGKEPAAFTNKVSAIKIKRSKAEVEKGSENKKYRELTEL